MAALARRAASPRAGRAPEQPRQPRRARRAGTRAACPLFAGWPGADAPKPRMRDPASVHSADGARVLWTIDNKRYDVTDYVDAHPGGRDAILAAQGRSATALFRSYHSLSDSAQAVLDRYYVEDAAPGDADYEDEWEWRSTPFHDALNRRVRAHFERKQARRERVRGGTVSTAHKAPAWKWAWLGAATVAWAASLAGFLAGSWAAMLAMPLLYWLGPSSLLHDGMHWSLSVSPRVNGALAALGGVHMEPTAWLHQHVIGHHSHTNVVERDPDLDHFTGSGGASVLQVGGGAADNAFYGFRCHAAEPWRPTFGAWKAWLPIMGLLTTVYPSMFESTEMLSRGSFLGRVPLVALSRSDVARLWLGRALVASVLWVAPFALHGLTLKALAFATLPLFIHGAVYYVFSQVSHIQPPCFEEPPEGERFEWAEMQVRHSLDWGNGGVVQTLASIGLNSQVVHHVYPQIDPTHYGELRPIFEQTCEEFGIPYHRQPSLWHALRSHVSLLQDMNRTDVWGASGDGAPAPQAAAAMA
eukprot:PRCOL_00002853-RA